MEELKTAIVTGAGKRVGAKIAAALLERGWTVVAHVHREDDEVPEGAVKVAADLVRPDCADAIFAAAAGLPPVRLLINNAARFAWDGFGEFSVAAPNPDFLSYTVSKQALRGVTELGARALASNGIRVNAIAPALMLQSPGQSEENFRAMHRRNPLGRPVTPADVIAAIDYLLAARTVTGEMLTIDAGQRFSPPSRDVQFLES